MDVATEKRNQNNSTFRNESDIGKAISLMFAGICSNNWKKIIKIMLQSIFLKMFGSPKQKIKINLKLSTYDRRLYTSILATFLLDLKLNHVSKPA